VHLPCCYAAQGKESRELGAEIRSEHAVSGVFVCGHAARWYEVPYPLMTGCLAAEKWDGGCGTVGRHLGRMLKIERGGEGFVESGYYIWEIGRNLKGCELRWYDRGQWWESSGFRDDTARSVTEGFDLVAEGGKNVGESVGVLKGEVTAVRCSY